MLKTAVALRHVHFEDLGTFAPVIEAAGYGVRYVDVGVDPLWTIDPVRTDLVIALGGPIGVYETRTYPVLLDELDLLRTRLAAGRPTLGLCLGAQMMAAALGAKVGATGVKEIGFSPLALTPDGARGPLRHLADVPVLHWHGDMFDLPAGSLPLAATPLCRNQAFAMGPNVLGLQFHPEADLASGFERWLIGHAAELAGAAIDPVALRLGAARHGDALRQAGSAMLADWLASLET
ncbi:glutamine amidotransferase [Aquabacter sp. L1I39]|uniref:glutamine amidotransferase n=1 Tax=Aquabacter sp. L1I39 TaxID=2820278 RepID=UPI001ADB30A4|nr:glutamine amidotransferase [Aquabacter sp. L1I39]QTL01645.1 glutamine amidotransferase [Aquabacter sp. L1I39]